MRLIRTTIALALTYLAATAGAQNASPSRDDVRLLGGVAGYSNETVAAIALVAGHPELPRVIAERMARGDDPLATLPNGLSDSQRAAVARVMIDAPEAIEVLAASGPAASDLSKQYVASPVEFAARLDTIRRAQADMQTAAARGWQFLLENDPVAMGDYRDMLTRYVLEQRKAEPRYAAVRVTDRRYYYATPPSEDFRRFAASSDAPRSLLRTMERWNDLYGQAATIERLQRVLSGDAMPHAGALTPMVIDLSPAERSTHWRNDEAVSGIEAGLGLLPVIMQPPADMPTDARSVRHAEQMAAMWLGQDAASAIDVAGDAGAADASNAADAPRDAHAAARQARQMRIGFHEDAEFSNAPVEISLNEIDATNRDLTQSPDDAVETIVTYEPGDFGGYADDFRAVTNTLILGYGNAYDPHCGVYRDRGYYGHGNYDGVHRCNVLGPCYPECLVSPPVRVNLGRPGATSSFYYGTWGSDGRDCDDDNSHRDHSYRDDRPRVGVSYRTGSPSRYHSSSPSRYGSVRDRRYGTFDRTPIRITQPQPRRDEIRINSAPSKLGRPQTLNPRGAQRLDRSPTRVNPLEMIRGKNATIRNSEPRSTTANRPAKQSTIKPTQQNRKKN